MHRSLPKVSAIFLCLHLGAEAAADPAEIVTAKAHPTGATWRFDVTIRHADTGWDDYADGWRIETEDGTVLGTRTLFHPHVDEQPFTRTLSGVAIPPALGEVRIRASTNADGWAKSTVALRLP